MKRNVIIVHGGNDDEEGAKEGDAENIRHWQPWIKKKLEEKGIEVSAELYPKNWEPEYKEWKEVFEKNDVSENSILIGHSDGCSFLVRWLGETKRKVEKLILVAPWKITIKGRSEEFFNYNIDAVIKDRVGEIIIFTSDNESEDQKKNFDMFHGALDGRVVRTKGQGHFTLGDMGTEEFPELLEEILK